MCLRQGCHWQSTSDLCSFHGTTLSFSVHTVFSCSLCCIFEFMLCVFWKLKICLCLALHLVVDQNSRHVWLFEIVASLSSGATQSQESVCLPEGSRALAGGTAGGMFPAGPLGTIVRSVVHGQKHFRAYRCWTNEVSGRRVHGSITC